MKRYRGKTCAALLGILGILLLSVCPVMAGGVEELTPEEELWDTNTPISSGVVLDSDNEWIYGKEQAQYGAALKRGSIDGERIEGNRIPFTAGETGDFVYTQCTLLSDTMVGALPIGDTAEYYINGYAPAVVLEDGTIYMLRCLDETFQVEGLILKDFRSNSFEYRFEGRYEGVPVELVNGVLPDEGAIDWSSGMQEVQISTSGRGHLGNRLSSYEYGAIKGLAFSMELDPDEAWTIQVGSKEQELDIMEAADFSGNYPPSPEGTVPESYGNVYQMPAFMIGDLGFASGVNSEDSSYNDMDGRPVGDGSREENGDMSVEILEESSLMHWPVVSRGVSGLPIVIAGAAGSFVAAAAAAMCSSGLHGSSDSVSGTSENDNVKHEETEEPAEAENGELIINEGEELPDFLAGMHLIYPIPVRVEGSDISSFRWSTFCVADDKGLDISVSISGVGQTAELLISLAGTVKEDHEAVINVFAVENGVKHPRRLHQTCEVRVLKEGLTVEPTDEAEDYWNAQLVCPGGAQGLARVISLQPGEFEIIHGTDGNMTASAEQDGKVWTAMIQPVEKQEKGDTEHGEA